LVQEGATAAAAPAPAPAAEKPAEAAPAIPAPAAPDDSVTGEITLSPAVRRAVLEHGIDPSTVKGSGKDGRLTKEDVLAAAKARESQPPSEADASVPAPSPSPAASAGAGERRTERVKMTRLRQTIARRLKSAQE